MSGFSEDGQWWSDGTTWVATAQVVLPQLQATEFEQSGKLKTARDRTRNTQWLSWADTIVPLVAASRTALLVIGQRAFRDYRSWKLEQLALATTYLLGPNEPMLAGEASLGPEFSDDSLARNLAVAVTAAHVLVFRFDSGDGQPRWVALAGRRTDVKLEYVRLLHWARILDATGRPVLGPGALVFGPALMVSGANGQWAIVGFPNVFKPEPVLEAWRQGADGAAKTG
jgi:hypothetical protein